MQKKKSVGPIVKAYHFLPRKYGRDLLLDLGRIESLKNFILDDTPHQISFYEILIIEKGKGIFRLDENEITIERGAIIFTSPGQVRRWHVKKPVSGYTLFFEKDFLNTFFIDDLFLYRFQFFHQYSKPTGITLPAESFKDTLKFVSDIEYEFNHLQSDSSHMLRAILYQLLVFLNRHFSAIHHLKNDTLVHPTFLRFRALLEKELHHYVTAYSHLLKVSTVHLNKICRQYSGMSAQQLIHSRQISEIKKQLRYDKSIKEIAYDFEFSDPSNFGRFFKKITGASPQQFRDNF